MRWTPTGSVTTLLLLLAACGSSGTPPDGPFTGYTPGGGLFETVSHPTDSTDADSGLQGAILLNSGVVACHDPNYGIDYASDTQIVFAPTGTSANDSTDALKYTFGNASFSCDANDLVSSDASSSAYGLFLVTKNQDANNLHVAISGTASISHYTTSQLTFVWDVVLDDNTPYKGRITIPFCDESTTQDANATSKLAVLRSPWQTLAFERVSQWMRERH